MTTIITLKDLKCSGEKVSTYDKSSILNEIRQMGDLIDSCENNVFNVLASEFPGQNTAEFKNLFIKIRCFRYNFNDLKHLHRVKEIMEMMLTAIQNLPIDASLFSSLPGQLRRKFIESSPSVISTVSSLSININSIDLINFERTFEWKVLQLDLSKYAKEHAFYLLEFRNLLLKEEGLSMEEGMFVESVIYSISKKETKKFDSSSHTSNETSSSAHLYYKALPFLYTSTQARRQWLLFLRSIIKNTFIFDFEKLPPEYNYHYWIILSMCTTFICEYFSGEGSQSITYKVDGRLERKQLLCFSEIFKELKEEFTKIQRDFKKKRQLIHGNNLIRNIHLIPMTKSMKLQFLIHPYKFGKHVGTEK